MTSGPERWADALLAAQLLAADPSGLRGAVVRARAGPVRDAWLEALADELASGRPWKRMPASIAQDRLLGGIDLSATLATGQPVSQRGLLAEADGGVLLVPMAERLAGMTAALLASTIDRGAVIDDLGQCHDARFLTILLDEGVDDEGVADALAERLAFRIDLDGLRLSDLAGVGPADGSDADDAAVADPVPPLCAAAAALGVGSLRAPGMALAAARAIARLRGASEEPSEADLMAAVRLVLAPRATRLPATEDTPADPPAEPPPEAQDAAAEPPAPHPADADGHDDDHAGDGEDLSDLLVETARAAIPQGLLEQLAAGHRGSVRTMASDAGRGEGKLGRAPTSGRRAGILPGRPRAGARLDLVETLKAAAPWQPLRRREAGGAPARPGLQVRVSDFRVRRLVRRIGSTILFVVDASGSAAMARLGEAKGAAELLLADAYVRRDDVAMIAFRGAHAELLLPPTRSLPRAKRALSDLAGGGGTPIATAIDCARLQALAIRARGKTPLVVLLTDGRANVAADGSPAAERAMADALAAARALRLDGIQALLIDTSARPRPEGRALAEAMGARHVPLPRFRADAVRDAVRAVA